MVLALPEDAFDQGEEVAGVEIQDRVRTAGSTGDTEEQCSCLDDVPGAGGPDLEFLDQSVGRPVWASMICWRDSMIASSASSMSEAPMSFRSLR